MPKWTLANLMDLYLYPRLFEPLFRGFFGKEDSVKETHHGFLSRSISARRQRSLLCRLRTKKKDTLTLVFLFALRWRKRCSDKGYVPQCINYINPYGFNQSRSGRANNRALFIAMSNVRHVDALYMEP